MINTITKNKFFKKISISIMMGMMLITNFLGMFSNVSFAADLNSAYLYSKGDCGSLLKYNGRTLIITEVVYKNNGVEYPAYCLDVEKPGVGEEGSYSVSINEALSNVLVWRAIVNGYPYKSYKELGCNNEKEAFAATKHAVYCMLYNRDVNNCERFEGIGEAGQRTLNALKTITKAARSSNETPSSPNMTITENSVNWELDKTNVNYVSKEFTVTSNSSYNKYKVSLTGDALEDMQIVDVNNLPKEEFDKGEDFKIIIPVKSLTKSGKCTVNVTSDTNTHVVLYGKAPNSNVQDYALATSGYEKSSGSKALSYSSNETNVTIIKQDGKTKKPLAGVEFRLLDANKNVVFTNLITDANGKIILNNMNPGKYFLEETKTLEGYTRYSKQIEINLEYRENLQIVVDNVQEEVSEVNKVNSVIEAVETRQSSKTSVTEKTQKNNIQSSNIENISNTSNITTQSVTNKNSNTQNNVDINKQDVTLENSNAQSNTNINKLDTIVENNNIEKTKDINSQNIKLKNINVSDILTIDYLQKTITNIDKSKILNFQNKISKNMNLKNRITEFLIVKDNSTINLQKEFKNILNEDDFRIINDLRRILIAGNATDLNIINNDNLSNNNITENTDASNNSVSINGNGNIVNNVEVIENNVKGDTYNTNVVNVSDTKNDNAQTVKVENATGESIVTIQNNGYTVKLPKTGM